MLVNGFTSYENVIMTFLEVFCFVIITNLKIKGHSSIIWKLACIMDTPTFNYLSTTIMMINSACDYRDN